MHFEILVEGQTDKIALSILMEKILGKYGVPHTWFLHKHQGLGNIPEDPGSRPNPKNPSLLHNLPAKLRAYGQAQRHDLVVVVLVDLDDRSDCITFKNSLVRLLDSCPQKPKILIRIAIEELEAWFLGDRLALQQAYPHFQPKVLENYIQDSQCQTRELLAKAISKIELSKFGKRSPKNLEQKQSWAKNICPYMNVEVNQSPSFQAFRDGLRKIAKQSSSEL